jgi:hypothetical protein
MLKNKSQYILKPKINQGQLTFDAEGNSNPNSIYYSRRAHWAGGASGVTIGRGYDLKTKLESQVRADFKMAGISDDATTQYVKCIGLYGADAKAACKSLPEITVEQEIALFNITYEKTEAYAEKLTKQENFCKVGGGAPDWSNLDPILQDVVVDLFYRGAYSLCSVRRQHVRGVRRNLLLVSENVRPEFE